MKRILILLLYTFTVDSLEHSHQCVQNLGGIRPCQNLASWGNWQACCDGVRQLALDQCECNPMVEDVMGGPLIYALEPVCRVIQPLSWLWVPFRFFRNLWHCGAIQSVSTQGCEDLPDVYLDAARYQNLIGFNKLFENSSNESICFDTPAFVQGLSQHMRENLTVYVPYGAGLYVGLATAAEYFGIIFTSLNHGWLQRDSTRSSDPHAAGRFDLNEPNIWYLGSTSVGGAFLRGRDPFGENYLEQSIEFEPCETKIAHFTQMPNPDF